MQLDMPRAAASACRTISAQSKHRAMQVPSSCCRQCACSRWTGQPGAWGPLTRLLETSRNRIRQQQGSRAGPIARASLHGARQV
jgi:hypothetical protein